MCDRRTCGNSDRRFAHTLHQSIDRMIVATAIAHDLTIVTRDLSGIAGLEDLVDVELR